MPMTPNSRKAALVERGITITSIAEELGVTVSHVAQVVRGEKESPRVEQAVANAIGKPVEEVFGDVAA